MSSAGNSNSNFYIQHSLGREFKSLSFQNQISYVMRNSNSKDFKNVFDGKFKIRKPQILNFRNSDSYKFKILVVCISLPPHAT